jgi:hypothetical protein
MEMMLWAEMNMSVQAFGRQCLQPVNRYLLWHGEDDFGLRGARRQLDLQQRLAMVLAMPVGNVTAAFPKKPTMGPPKRKSRQLDYGKFTTSQIAPTKLVKCAVSGHPGALREFEYAKGHVEK